MTHSEVDGPRSSKLTRLKKSLETQELYQVTYPCGTELQMVLHLTNIYGLMKELLLISLKEMLTGIPKDTMLESITSLLQMEVTGKSKTKEIVAGHSQTNAMRSQLIKLMEIPVCAYMVPITSQTHASPRPHSISMQKDQFPSSLVWEILNPQETTPLPTTASSTDSHSMVDTG